MDSVQGARQLMFHPNVDAATPARVHAWRKARSGGGGVGAAVGGGQEARAPHAAITDLRSFTPQQHPRRGALSGTFFVSCSPAEGASRLDTLLVSGAARQSQAQGNGGDASLHAARFNTPARTRAQAWGEGPPSEDKGPLGSGSEGRQASREVRHRQHRGHAGLFTPATSAPSAPHAASDAYWVKSGGGATVSEAAAALPGRSARPGTTAAARRRAVFGEAGRPPAHTVASERKAEVAGGLKQEATLLAHQLRVLQGPRR